MSRDKSRDFDAADVARFQNVGSMGQFSVTDSSLNALCQGIDVEALSILRKLDALNRRILLFALLRLYTSSR